jgi:hypothetical protein
MRPILKNSPLHIVDTFWFGRDPTRIGRKRRWSCTFPQADFWLQFTGFTSTCGVLYGRVNLVRMTISSAVSQSFPSNRMRSFLISPRAASTSSVLTPAAILSAQWIWRCFNIFITRRPFFVRRTSLALL